LRSLSELTTEMTKAGLDPSRIQERAEMLAKVQGAKRKRNADDDEDVEMDEGEDDDVDDDGLDKGMDVDDDDDDESSPSKRVKTNSGGVINKRAPRSNRQAAGMRDEGVSCPSNIFFYFTKT
jgi:nucleolar GTP-binding protein